MTGINGLELIAELQKQIPEVKCNLLTANIQPGMYSRCKALNLVIPPKPIDKEKVIKIMKGFQKG